MINYTINSTDPLHYNTIKINLPNQTNWQHAILTVSSLVTLAYIVILDENDYIKIRVENEQTATVTTDIFYVDQQYLNFTNLYDVLTMVRRVLGDFPFVGVDRTANELLRFTARVIPINFSVDMSYNMKLVTGFYSEKTWPLVPVVINRYNILTAKTVGFLSSTSIFYLMSTLGDVNIHNSVNSDDCSNDTVLMRIQNTFSPEMPLVASNAEFTKKISVGDITNFECRLVDANLHDLRLLYPMWVCFTIQEAPADERDKEDFWQFSYVRMPRQVLPPSALFPINPQLLEAIEEEPVAFS
jgi:hypothetical protein